MFYSTNGTSWSQIINGGGAEDSSLIATGDYKWMAIGDNNIANIDLSPIDVYTIRTDVVPSGKQTLATNGTRTVTVGK